MSARVKGLAIGLVFGIMWAAFGFGAALLAGFLAITGWLVGGMVEGRINIAEVWDDLQGRWRDFD